MSDTSTTREEGMMDIGTHCSFCRQIDFLPFICDKCGSAVCSSHRNPESHYCASSSDTVNSNSSRFSHFLSAKPSNTLTSASLFPDRSQDKKKLELALKAPPKPTTILQKVNEEPTALKKLKRFFMLQKKKQSTNSVFRPKVSSATNKILTLSLCKKHAAGDSKISQSERVFIWCIYLSDPNEFEKINLDNDKKAIYVSRAWPVGRALDQIAFHLKIKNINNRTTDSKEKLSVFRDARTKDEGVDPVPIDNNGRVIKELKDGDTIYLVRGADI